MKNEDVELIQRVLGGDENAFSALVRKYQKPVHALVWRKIGDFHIAEEITQDAFLKAYKELATLKKPHLCFLFSVNGELDCIKTTCYFCDLRFEFFRGPARECCDNTLGDVRCIGWSHTPSGDFLNAHA